MKQYIDKSTVVAEIERRKEFWQSKRALAPAPYAETECKKILSFIDTLEVKEVKNFIWNNARTTVPEDSTNQIICIKEDGLAVLTIGKIVNGTVKWAYLDDLLNTNNFKSEVKEVDLDDEKDAYICNHFSEGSDGGMISDAHREIGGVTYFDLSNIAEHFFKLGLKAKGELL